MSYQDREVNVIKIKEWNTELDSLLNSYTKAQLIELAENLGRPVVKSWRKDKMLAAVEESILEQVATIYGPLIEDVLSHFPEPDTQAYRVKQLEDIKAFIPLIKKGFFFVSKEQDNYIFIIPDEIKEEFSSSTDASDSKRVLNEWKEKQVSIYGTYSASHLHTLWNRYSDEPLSLADVKKALNKTD